MPRTRPAYPEEFKLEAVQMVRAGRSAGDVASALGCSPQSVTNWVRRFERDQGIRKDGLNTEEREELKRLRRENVRLKQERDLLKRAALGSTRQRNAWFSVLAGVLKPRVLRGRVLSFLAT